MTLALIVGRGDLPAILAKAVGPMPLICAYEGIAVRGLVSDLTFRLETLGTLLAELKVRGISRVCFAGGLDRPALDPSKLDTLTLPLVPAFLDGMKAGDDGALRVVLGLFENAGFEVIGAHEVAPDILAKEGVYGTHAPDAQMQKDAACAADHLALVSAQDIGQACVVGGAQVLAMESAGGTDAMLGCLENPDRAILYKAPKAQQSRLVDMPTVGPDTLSAAHHAGLVGVVVEAGGVLVLHPELCTKRADELGLVFWARPVQ